MSAFLADAIWKYWMLTGDCRAPASLAMYAKFTERHAIEDAGKEIRERYGFGKYGMPESHEDGDAFDRIAHRRWASDKLTETFAKMHKAAKAIRALARGLPCWRAATVAKASSRVTPGVYTANLV